MTSPEQTTEITQADICEYLRGTIHHAQAAIHGIAHAIAEKLKEKRILRNADMSCVEPTVLRKVNLALLEFEQNCEARNAAGEVGEVDEQRIMLAQALVFQAVYTLLGHQNHTGWGKHLIETLARQKTIG